MSKVIEKGDFVRHEGKPEYGVGRVLAVEVFATRVLFPSGGLRVFRAHDTVRLHTAPTPSVDDLAILDGKQELLTRGVPDMPRGKPAAEAAAPKKKRPKKVAAT
jgi:hypothetical protein